MMVDGGVDDKEEEGDDEEEEEDDGGRSQIKMKAVSRGKHQDQ